MNYRRTNAKIATPGFTLIELLVVISIIGLLSVIVMVALRTSRIRASSTRLSADAKSILTQINVTRTSDLVSLTGNGCTMCWFDVSQTVNSQTAMVANLQNSWKKVGFTLAPVDPWGTPYLLNENEDVNPLDPCQYDTVYSAGSNGYWEGVGDNAVLNSLKPGVPVPSGAGDDYVFAVDFGKTCSVPS